MQSDQSSSKDRKNMRMNAKKVSLNSFNAILNQKRNQLDTKFKKSCNRIEEKSGAEIIKNTEKSYECKIFMDNQLTVAFVKMNHM